jgi:hypothetical protein
MISSAHSRLTKSNLRLPKASGGELKIHPNLLDSLAIAGPLIRSQDDDARSALQWAWSRVWKKIAAGEFNPVCWLDDALAELSETRVWVPSIFLKRLRQLQRGEIVFKSKLDEKLKRVPHYGLPPEFAEAAKVAEIECAIVRRIGEGYEELFSGNLVTQAVELVVCAWRDRPSSANEECEYLKAAFRRAGWTAKP